MNLGNPNLAVTSTAVVEVERAARYAKQLVSHMSRKFGGGWDPASESGWMQLGETGRAEVAVQGGTITMQVSGPDLEAIERVEGAVGRHLVRFVGRDDLQVAWSRNDGTAGTVQRLDEPRDLIDNPPETKPHV
ncbi:DUF2218 domain-containing protein [Tessaracoccus massiliensis]|uniref:DUF2218 domain-containing protein n=1 Tax=Tessaracoccus massiliensis TaxID=1522311 RepID=UPI000693F645|nr:DUF2218 domain-containing protein [Tessaracoccus massiliensis]